VDWKRRYALGVRLRPVYPLAIRTPEFFERQHPQWGPYLVRDVHRVAEFLGIPFQWPRPDPIVQYRRDGKFITGDEQPYIARLTRLGVVAEERGRGIECAEVVSRLIWGGTENWHEGDRLATAVAEVGFELAELDARVEREAVRLEAQIEQNQQDHAQAGHWGVPTCVFRGEPFFGQDRLDVLLWRLQQAGLRER